MPKNPTGQRKNPGGRPRVYSMDERAAALLTLAQKGLAETVKETGIPKGTLHQWATQEGVNTVVNEAATKRTEAATAISRASRHQRLLESENRLMMQLAVIAELAASVEIKALRAANGQADRLPAFVGKSSELTLNEVVGVRTRAIHDLQLMMGKATDRTENVDSLEDIASLRDELQKRLGA